MYKELIDYYMSRGPEIEKQSNSFISLTSHSSLGTTTQMSFGYGFDHVNVFWDYHDINGKHSLKWRFSETLPQFKMILTIEKDINVYLANIVMSNL